MSNMSIALKYYSPEALEEFAEETNTHLGAITSYIAYTGKWDKDDYDEAFCGRMDRDELADYLVTAFVDAHNISESARSRTVFRQRKTAPLLHHRSSRTLLAARP